MASMPTEIVVALGAVFAVGRPADRVRGVCDPVQAVTGVQRRLEAMRQPDAAAHVVLTGSLTAGRDPSLARWYRLLPRSVRDMSRL